jgi:hypothetical protein
MELDSAKRTNHCFSGRDSLTYAQVGKKKCAHIEFGNGLSGTKVKRATFERRKGPKRVRPRRRPRPKPEAQRKETKADNTMLMFLVFLIVVFVGIAIMQFWNNSSSAPAPSAPAGLPQMPFELDSATSPDIFNTMGIDSATSDVFSNLQGGNFSMKMPGLF